MLRGRGDRRDPLLTVNLPPLVLADVLQLMGEGPPTFGAMNIGHGPAQKDVLAQGRRVTAHRVEGLGGLVSGVNPHVVQRRVHEAAERGGQRGIQPTPTPRRGRHRLALPREPRQERLVAEQRLLKVLWRVVGA